MAGRRNGAAAEAWYRRKDRSPSAWNLESKRARLVAGRHLEHHKWSISCRDWLTNRNMPLPSVTVNDRFPNRWDTLLFGVPSRWEAAPRGLLRAVQS